MEFIAVVALYLICGFVACLIFGVIGFGVLTALEVIHERAGGGLCRRSALVRAAEENLGGWRGF